jgi:hypothetical protein
MYVFHFNEYVVPWVMYLIVVILAISIVAVASSFAYKKKKDSNSIAWIYALLTGLAVGFILAVGLVIFSSNQTLQNENENKTALKSFVENNYNFSDVKQKDINVLYLGKEQKFSSVTLIDKNSKSNTVYLEKYKDGWSLFNFKTKQLYPQNSN